MSSCEADLKKKISKCSHFSPKPATPRGVFPSCAAIPWIGIKQDPRPKLMRHGSSQVDTIPVLTATAPAPRQQDLPSHPALLPILQFPKVYSFANPSKNHRQGSCISHLQGTLDCSDLPNEVLNCNSSEGLARKRSGCNSNRFNFPNNILNLNKSRANILHTSRGGERQVTHRTK